MNKRLTESPLWFHVAEEPLLGILHHAADGVSDVGMVLVVGGPQYRVGSHRQFVLLARAVAAAGIPVLRFDYRGMGDSPGAARTFENVEDDIRAAVDTLVNKTGVTRVALWGLCDGASASMMYAGADPRITAVIALNPWVHTEAGEARVRIRHYYLQRLASGELWRKLFSGQFDWRSSLSGLLGFAKKLSATPASGSNIPVADVDYVTRMQRGLQQSDCAFFLLLSGQDFTADEFRELSRSNKAWGTLLAERCAGQHRLPDANHTCARADWRADVERHTIAWLRASWD